MLDELNDKEEKTMMNKDAIKLLEDQRERVLNLMEASIKKKKGGKTLKRR